MIAVLLPGFSFATYLFIFNKEYRKIDEYSKVTFIDPTEALIFWRTTDEAVCYLDYGNSRFKLDETESQTSSTSGTIHVVVLDNIPLDGIYISKHCEGESILLLPKVEKIQYNEEDNG